MLPSVPLPPPTAPVARRPQPGETSLPKMAATTNGVTSLADAKEPSSPTVARRKSEASGGQFRASKYFATNSPRSLSPQNLPKRRTPSPLLAAGGDGFNAARALAVEGDDGPPAMQGSRLHFSSSLDRDSNAGGPVYGPGSFATPQELSDFLARSEVDTSAWLEGEAKGVNGLLRELEKLETTLQIEDRRLVRREKVVRVRAHRADSTEYLVERRTTSDGSDPVAVLGQSTEQKKTQPKLPWEARSTKVDLWQSATASIFSTQGTMLAGNVLTKEQPADRARILANTFASHAAQSMGLDSPAQRQGTMKQAFGQGTTSSFIRAIAQQLEASGASPYDVQMIGLVQEADEYALDQHYPGLVTKRTFYEYAMRIPILPETNFESVSMLGSTQVTHHWEWHAMRIRHDGVVLTPTQRWLLEALFAGCARLEVSKLHPFQDDMSESLLLRTNSYDVNGEPDEPTITKIAAAQAIVNETDRTNYVLKTCGVDALRPVRPPMFAIQESKQVLLTSDAKIDAPLRDSLQDGAIRLLRCSWIMSDDADNQLPIDLASGASIMCRQKDLPREAFFPCEEAVKLLDRGDRSVFVISQCWQTTEHPDPHGSTLLAVRQYLRSVPDAHSCGLYWDWTGLPEASVGWRSEVEEHELSLPCYASFSGTCVLQLKTVPPRPPQYDGLVMLVGVPDSISEDELRQDASEFGEVLECEIVYGKAAVHFSSHAAAEEMVGQFALRNTFDSMRADKYHSTTCDFAYDDRPYDGENGRGWSIFEQAVSVVVATLLGWAEAKGHLPQRYKLAQETRPKVIDISHGVVITPSIDPNSLEHPRLILDQAKEAMEKASFSVEADAIGAKAQLEALVNMLHEGVRTSNLDNIGAVVLEMGEACWTLPEYCSRLGEGNVISCLKEHITRQLSEVEDDARFKSPIDVLRELWGPGGQLNRMAYKSIKRGSITPTDNGGLIDQTLFGIVDALSSALFAPESSWPDTLREVARDAGYTPSPPTEYTGLHKCIKGLLDSGEYPWIANVHESADQYGERFQDSFVFQRGDGAWAQQKEGGQSLIDVLKLLDKALKQDASLRGVKDMNTPLLLVYAHKNLNLENILVDAAGGMWLSNFVDSGFGGLFEDAVKVIAELLFESFPVPFTLQEVKTADVQRLMKIFQLAEDAAARLSEAAESCNDVQQLVALIADDAALETVLTRISEDALAEQRAQEACDVLEMLLSPIHAGSSDVRRVPTLMQLSKCTAPASWSPQARLMLKLITTVVQFSYELCAKCSQEEQARSKHDEAASYLAEDLHIAHFLLPLLRLALGSLCDASLSLWQKRVAWRASQMLAAASCEVLRRPTAQPPKYSHRSKRLKLADGQIIGLRSSGSKDDGGASTNLPLIVGERGKTAPTYDECSHVVLPWMSRKIGGAAIAMVESGGLHDYQVEQPRLATLIKQVPVPPDPSLCMKFDVSPEQMTIIVESLRAEIEDVRGTCKTPAIREEVDRALVEIVELWGERQGQRETYDRDLEVELKTSSDLVQTINLLEGERWRMEARQKAFAVEIEAMKEAAIKGPQDEKSRLDTQIGLERRKVLKFKHRLMSIKENTRRRMLEQAAAEKEADAAAARYMTTVSSSRDETLEEQAIRERNEANARQRRKDEDSKRIRLAEEEQREKAYIQKREGETKRGLVALQQECALVDQQLRAAKEIEDRVKLQDGKRIVDPAWLAVQIEECVIALRTLNKTSSLDLSTKTTDQKFDEAVQGEYKKFASRHPKITALLRREVLFQMDEEAQGKKASERAKRDPFVDKLLEVRFAQDEYNATELAIKESFDKVVVAKQRQKSVAQDEAKLRRVEMKQQSHFCRKLADIVRFDLEAKLLRWCSESISQAGALGARDYAEGQQLIVRCGDGQWRDAVVLESPTSDGENTHLLMVDSDGDVWEDGDSFGTEVAMMLDPFNHAPRELPIATFDIMRKRWTRSMRSLHATVVDPITGTRINVTRLCVSMKYVSWSGVPTPLPLPLVDGLVEDANELTDWIQKAHALRCDGDASFRACLLLTGPSASGKTCIMSRIVVHLIDGNDALDGNLVPIFVHVHDLQRQLMIESNLEIFGEAWNWIDAYLQIVHGADSETYSMLRQAMMARRALLLLDGIDEGGTARDRILRHVTEVLAPQGHMLVITSRPNGVHGKVFDEHFHQLELCPMSDQQQAALIESQLARNEAIKLTKWIHKKLPPQPSTKDPEVKHRLTANPLMLGLIVTLYEHQALVGTRMPTSMVDVYETTCSVALQRIERNESGAIASKIAEPHVSRLLEAVFLEVHNNHVRVIEEEHLEMAALSLVAPEQLKAIQARGNATLRRSALRVSCKHLPPELSNAMRLLRERMMQDRIPMLRLLQANPLQMISHLAFQEYYAARAICRGRPLEEKPWNWAPWWANVLKLGLDMGDQFGSGLLRASGVTQSTLDLRGELPKGERPLTLDAVVALVRSKDTPLTYVDLSKNRLEESEMRVIGEAMLSNFKSRITGFRADAFNLKVEDTSLAVPRMRIRPEGFVLMAGALRSNTTLTSLNVSSNYMVYWAGHERNRIVTTELCGIKAMATAISDTTRTVTCALKHLDLSSNALGPQGAEAVSSILKNRMLKSLSLRDNKLGDEGVDALAAGLDGSTLEELDIGENQIRIPGVKTLADALRKMKALKTLNFAGNHVLGNSAVEGPELEGVRALAYSVTHSNLKHLDLSSCQLCGVWDDAESGKHGDEANFTLAGVKAIAGALAECSSLTSISVQNNKIEISQEAIKALTSANKQRPTPAAVAY